MQKSMWTKGLVLGIIVLFIGASIGSISSKSKNMNAALYDRIEVWKSDSYHPYGNMVEDGNGTLHILDDIQSAFEYINTSGTVYVHKGNYNIGIVTLVLDKPFKLIGENQQKTIISSGKNAPYIIDIQSKGITLDNFTITGAKSGYEPSSTQAGIRTSLKYNLNFHPVIISHNIVTNNSNGMFLYHSTLGYSKDIAIIIYGNEIFDNENDGIITATARIQIIENNIHDNYGSGIDLWGMKNNIIESNDIYNNGIDGIWIDQASNNTIFNNTIKENHRNGVTLFSSAYPEQTLYCINNTIEKNNIISNDLSGLYLYHAKDNHITKNLIENNKQVGLKIMVYKNLSILFREFREGFPTSTGNDIYYNNFINNGENGMSNAIDTWMDSKNTYINNYWADYIIKYSEEATDENFDRNGTWDTFQEYQIPLSFLDIIRLDFLSNNEDDKPWCRKNGWVNESWPEKPIFKPVSSTSAHINEKLYFTIQSEDLNNDLIQFGINWSSTENDSTCDLSKLTINNWSSYYPSGKLVVINNSWPKNGTYYVRVIARDYCEYDKKSDGNSPWSISIKVDIIK